MSLLESVALGQGLVDPGQRSRAVRQARVLLERFKDHPIWEEIESAEARYHEVPYTRSLPGGRNDAGAIDLLYRTDGHWELIDFKVDELQNEAALEEAVSEHRAQIERYEAACRQLLGVHVQAQLCFLDCMGEVRLV